MHCLGGIWIYASWGDMRLEIRRHKRKRHQLFHPKRLVELLKLSNKKYGQTLIVITHDEQIALQADRVIAIEDGRIIRDERLRAAMREDM